MNAIVINFFLAGLILVIAIFVLVYTIDRFRRNKTRKSLLEKLNRVAADNQAELTTVGFPGDRVIGIDLNSKILIFFGYGNKPEIIDLKDVVQCNIKKHFHRRHLYSIQLALLQADEGKIHLLPFYQKPVDTELGLSSAMKSAVRWHGIISDCLMRESPRARLAETSLA